MKKWMFGVVVAALALGGSSVGRLTTATAADRGSVLPNPAYGFCANFIGKRCTTSTARCLDDFGLPTTIVCVNGRWAYP